MQQYFEFQLRIVFQKIAHWIYSNLQYTESLWPRHITTDFSVRFWLLKFLTRSKRQTFIKSCRSIAMISIALAASSFAIVSEVDQITVYVF